MRTIAKATKSECTKLDLITPLSEEAKQTAGMQEFPYDKDVFIYEQPQRYAISREMLQFHNITCTDLMVMNLKSDNQVLGALVLITAIMLQTPLYESTALMLVKVGRELLYQPEIGAERSFGARDKASVINSELAIVRSQPVNGSSSIP